MPASLGVLTSPAFSVPMTPDARLTCHLCGQEHRPVRLEPGEAAICVRCGSVLMKGVRAGPDTALVFSITGLTLALPAALLPFVSANFSSDERISLLFTGVGRLWNGGMRSLAVLVFLCGGLLPLTLLATLASLHAGSHLNRFLLPVARALEHWAIPEVQVLAVLVALMKLGSVVDLTIGLGFWCYCAMALSLLIAVHSFEFNPTTPPPDAGELDVAAPS
jgi:paraquat-inducible protein A